MSASRSFFRVRRRLTAGVVGLACTAVLAGGMLAPAAPALAVDAGDPEVRSDPDVLRAESELDGARGQLSDLQARLDGAASEYEHARAHHLRLVEEINVSSGTVEAARERTLTARAAWGQRIANAYKHPEVDVSLGEAILGAPDAATAVHRTALVTTVTARGGQQVTDAQRLAEAVSGEARQQQVVGAGTAAALREREQLAERLEQFVGSARDALGDAEVALADAEQTATDRVEARRQAAADAAEQARERAEREAAERARAARERAATSAAGTSSAATSPSAGAGGSAPAPVGGKVCPVGTPNGFIDSWGYPRSGGRRHQGVDIFAARGTPIYAIADGVISRVSSNSLGGLVIYMVDDDGAKYYYAHLDTQGARQGQRVRAGDVIGTVGNTGNARTTPPHLHWQYHPGNGAAVNPYPLAAKLCKGT